MFEQPQSGMELVMKYSPMAFLYAAFPVYVEIEGSRLPVKWGTQFIPLPPGRYNVTCYVHYMVTPKAGLNTAVVDLFWGTVARVTWTAPPVVFMKGAIKAEVIAQAPQPDPVPNPTVPHGVGAAPPAVPPIPLTGAGPAACPACGASDTGARFCGKCSRQLRP
ncbi:MAG TPA: hypothetical protein VKT77_12750 [Chthonomonadaceae bacterium]|nr:hypothetical protein [Chthonomonadaceae bacterium]